MAAAAASKNWPSSSVETNPIFPRGCYYTVGSTVTSNNAYFNAHAVGAGLSRFQLLCAALATTGAPLHASMRADARVLRGTRGRCVL